MQTVSQKKYILVLLVIAVMIFLCGCGDGYSSGQQDDHGSSEAVEDINDELTALFETNNGSYLSDSMRSVKVSALYNTDGYQETAEVSRTEDGELIFLESGDDYQRVVFPDQGYYQTMDGMQSQLVFIGDQYDEIYLQQRLPFLTWGTALTEWLTGNNLKEEITDTGLSAGRIADELMNDPQCELKFDENDSGEMMLAISLQIDGGRLTDHYLYDRTDYHMIRADSYQESVSGEDELICKKQINYLSNHQADIPDFVSEMRQAEKRRLVVFIADPGKETEERYECDAPTDAFVSPYYDSEYGLYADPEGKEPFAAQPAAADGSMPDAVIYLIKTTE